MPSFAITPVNVAVAASESFGTPNALILTLAAAGDVQGTFNGEAFSDWVATAHTESAGAHWDDDDQTVVFDAAGVYEIAIQGRVAVATFPETWPGTDAASVAALAVQASMIGTTVPGALSQETTRYSWSPADPFPETYGVPTTAVWSDVFTFDASTLPSSFQPSLYASRYNGGGGVDATFEAFVTVKLIAEATVA